MKIMKIKKLEEMTWFAWRIENGTAEPYNIFNSCNFSNGIEKLYKKYKKDSTLELDKELKRLLMYCFWSKFEYEVIVTTLTTFPPYNERNERKIDVYQQVAINFDKFYAYVKSVFDK